MFEKFSGFFDPSVVTHPIHIIGCGAIGSTLAIMLTRCGLSDIHLWDFDSVENHNIANQQYLFAQIGMKKTTALSSMMTDINPQCRITLHGRWIDDILTGHVFLALDNIDTRREVVNAHRYKDSVQSFWDFRLRLKDAQHYGYAWNVDQNRINLLKTMAFTHEEAKASTPVNACNMTMSIMPTVQTVVSVGVGNFINYLHDVEPKRLIMVNPFDMMID